MQNNIQIYKQDIILTDPLKSQLFSAMHGLLVGLIPPPTSFEHHTNRVQTV